MTTASPNEERVLVAAGLAKTFKIGFMMKKVVAVRDSTFDVRRGEIFGIVGPNGAGKTTTIKMLVGLIRPGAGSATIFGEPISSVHARRRVAFLPETPHFYDYLRPVELLDYFGDLYGMDRTTKRRRIPELLERVGLGGALDKPLRKFSKGMLQRVGLAQALLPECDLVILDEPQSGLDPIGRKDVRDLILEENARGRTIVMCSHILPDVEQICQRVAILVAGRVTRVGRLDELVDMSATTVEVTLRCDDELAAKLGARVARHERNIDGTHRFDLGSANETQPFVVAALGDGAELVAAIPHRQSLEDVFHQQALRTNMPGDDR
ncbi:MAG: ABC transporter ATP-binding protein [Myxococcales bacterium]|nr:ABC transporter ATP-binding protein [Myxococcales bacterium]MCB9521657.1 ABC transporter ATP-binding protein [Myxococcales bacterium]MCB9533760.1 ABC transporter ATP-binding protein [Myxococcales bacterium]